MVSNVVNWVSTSWSWSKCFDPCYHRKKGVTYSIPAVNYIVIWINTSIQRVLYKSSNVLQNCTVNKKKEIQKYDYLEKATYYLIEEFCWYPNVDNIAKIRKKAYDTVIWYENILLWSQWKIPSRLWLRRQYRDNDYIWIW